MVALLPGSRMPEALANFALQLQLCELIQARQPMQFVAALVPGMAPTQINDLATRLGWHLDGDQILRKGNTQVSYYSDAFADIVQRCDLALGMAGTAVEQVVGLGKPVVQIIGHGPQFTYPLPKPRCGCWENRSSPSATAPPMPPCWPRRQTR
jgi:uncharacterized protein (TIGR03492 family)